MIRSIVLGCGAYLPQNVMTNDDLIKAWNIDSSDEWIKQRTGIAQRHFAAPGEKTSDLATNAAKEALKSAGVDIADIDMIVVATTTPDNRLPSVAAKVQANLGMARGFAFDVQAVCSGFVYALTVADKFIRCGDVKKALVIGAETLSSILDKQDRGTNIIFGDGAGAVVLGSIPGKGDVSDRGILSTHLHCDGRHYDLLYTDEQNLVRMNGKEVFRHAVTNLSDVVDEALAANGLKPEQIDWLVPHQANQRIIDGTGKKLNLPAERVISTVAEHANTSAASVPMALFEATKDGRIKPGDIVLLDAMGGGFTWGAIVMRW